MSIMEQPETGVTVAGTAPEAGIADVVAARPMRKQLWKRFRRNKLAVAGLIFLLLLVLAAIFAPLITKFDPISDRTRDYRAGPSTTHWFGTDSIGRDVFSRVLYGARISLRIGIVATLMSLVIGLFLGAISGFFGGKTDTGIMRITDIGLAIPYIVLAVAIATIFGKSQNSVILVLGLTGWLAITRIVRASFLSVKQQEYIEAARALGLNRSRIMFRHILPNAIQPIIVYGTIAIGSVILAEAALSFLGVGLQLPAISWGLMISDSQNRILTSPHLLLFPGAFLSVLVLCFIILGDQLRDALDPRLR